MEESPGTVIIAPQVLMTIARQAALSVPGVSRMSSRPGGVDRLFRGRSGQEGVQAEIEEGLISLDLFIVAEPEANMLRLGEKVQKEVARAIQDMVGMAIREINVHIEDVASSRAAGQRSDEDST